MSADDVFNDALIAVHLCAIDPKGLGGVVLRGAGPARDALVERLKAILPEGMPFRRLPISIDDDRLLGGLDVAATLSAERSVARAGLLAEADGGFVVVAMAERMSEALAARIAGVLDTGEAVVEREGLAARYAARFGLLILDDGREEDERVPVAIDERLAFRFDVSTVREGEMFDIPNAVGDASTVEMPDPALTAIAATAAAFGVESTRAALFTVRAARASAALFGRSVVDDDDVTLAARLVLGPRATRLPPDDGEAEAPQPEAAPPDTGEDQAESETQAEPPSLDDLVIAAVRTTLPPDILAKIAAGVGRRQPTGGGGSGERRKSPSRGRPLGSRAGLPRGGARVSLIDTLRTAAPWQRLRRGEAGLGSERVLIRRDDIRIKRFENRAEATTIFAVDASGSAAIARLGEAKGAVELLLTQAYVKRTQVALITFRGSGAELLLPPTRSLARARRCLAELPGGGGTPMFAGIEAARELAGAVKAKGRTPFVVVLSDGRANIAADGSTVREAAKADAERAGRQLQASGTRSVFIDTGTRPRPEGEAIAAAMGARYLPLPRADAATMTAAIQAIQA